MSNIITPGCERAGTSKKITVTIFSTESKKLWLVSHKSRVFVFQKYFGHPPFWTFIGHVAYMLRKWQHFTQCPKMGVCTEWVDMRASATTWIWNIPISNEIFSAEKCVSHNFRWFQPGLLWKYSNFKRNIFGWKVSFRMFSYGSNQDFYN